MVFELFLFLEMKGYRICELLIGFLESGSFRNNIVFIFFKLRWGSFYENELNLGIKR